MHLDLLACRKLRYTFLQHINNFLLSKESRTKRALKSQTQEIEIVVRF